MSAPQNYKTAAYKSNNIARMVYLETSGKYPTDESEMEGSTWNAYSRPSDGSCAEGHDTFAQPGQIICSCIGMVATTQREADIYRATHMLIRQQLRRLEDSHRHVKKSKHKQYDAMRKEISKSAHLVMAAFLQLEGFSDNGYLASHNIRHEDAFSDSTDNAWGWLASKVRLFAQHLTKAPTPGTPIPAPIAPIAGISAPMTDDHMDDVPAPMPDDHVTDVSVPVQDAFGEYSGDHFGNPQTTRVNNYPQLQGGSNEMGAGHSESFRGNFTSWSSFAAGPEPKFMPAAALDIPPLAKISPNAPAIFAEMYKNPTKYPRTSDIVAALKLNGIDVSSLVASNPASFHWHERQHIPELAAGRIVLPIDQIQMCIAYLCSVLTTQYICSTKVPVPAGSLDYYVASNTQVGIRRASAKQIADLLLAKSGAHGYSIYKVLSTVLSTVLNDSGKYITVMLIDKRMYMRLYNMCAVASKFATPAAPAAPANKASGPAVIYGDAKMPSLSNKAIPASATLVKTPPTDIPKKQHGISIANKKAVVPLTDVNAAFTTAFNAVTDGMSYRQVIDSVVLPKDVLPISKLIDRTISGKLMSPCENLPNYYADITKRPKADVQLCLAHVYNALTCGNIYAALKAIPEANWAYYQDGSDYVALPIAQVGVIVDSLRAALADRHTAVPASQCMLYYAPYVMLTSPPKPDAKYATTHVKISIRDYLRIYNLFAHGSAFSMPVSGLTDADIANIKTCLAIASMATLDQYAVLWLNDATNRAPLHVNDQERIREYWQIAMVRALVPAEIVYIQSQLIPAGGFAAAPTPDPTTNPFLAGQLYDLTLAQMNYAKHNLAYTNANILKQCDVDLYTNTSDAVSAAQLNMQSIQISSNSMRSQVQQLQIDISNAELAYKNAIQRFNAIQSTAKSSVDMYLHQQTVVNNSTQTDPSIVLAQSQQLAQLSAKADADSAAAAAAQLAVDAAYYAYTTGKSDLSAKKSAVSLYDNLLAQAQSYIAKNDTILTNAQRRQISSSSKALAAYNEMQAAKSAVDSAQAVVVATMTAIT
jgi:hypothetical protein